MIAVRLPRVGIWPAFRDTARRLIGAGIEPGAVDWEVEGVPTGLFADPVPIEPGPDMTLSRSLASLMRDLTAIRGGEGLALAYAMLWRARNDHLRLDNRADPDVARARNLAKSIHRDLHKMHAFVRFQEVSPLGTRRRFAAWFEPENRIEDPVAPFFAKRFGDMDWIIRTPEVTITFAEGKTHLIAQSNSREIGEDTLEELWCSYYTHIFNPARLKVSAMTSEMPQKYWHNLPEAKLIPGLIAQAEARRDDMIAKGATTALSDVTIETLSDMPRALNACERCKIGCLATQAVAGSGPDNAAVMIVGEQPGDFEDRAGQPFVGPAGQLLDQALHEAGIDRGAVYLTNAVKHFKFTRKGTRRIHVRPDRTEVEACSWWLGIEQHHIAPRVTIALGATAALALTGSDKNILNRRSQFETSKTGDLVLITVHPSWILRLPDPKRRQEEIISLAHDLRIAAERSMTVSG